jgi:dodecin
VHNIKSVYVKEFQAIVEGDQVVKYRINGKISFIVEEKK